MVFILYGNSIWLYIYGIKIAFKNPDLVTGNVGQCVKVGFHECWPVLQIRINLIADLGPFFTLLQIRIRFSLWWIWLLILLKWCVSAFTGLQTLRAPEWATIVAPFLWASYLEFWFDANPVPDPAFIVMWIRTVWYSDVNSDLYPVSQSYADPEPQQWC